MHHVRSPVLFLALAACRSDPGSRPDCDNSLDWVAEQEFVDERGAAHMQEFCDAHPRGVHVDGPVRIDSTTARRLTLGCVCSVTDLVVDGNLELLDLSGLDGLRSIHGDLIIAGNAALTTLAGLPDPEIAGSVVIADNDALRDLAGLPPDLTGLAGGLSITSNAGLTSLEGLPDALGAVESLKIQRNDALLDLHGLPSTLHVRDSVSVRSNARLRTLAGLPAALDRVGYFYVDGNPALEHLGDGLSALRDIEVIELWENPTLVDLSGLPAGLRVDTLRIVDNDGLRSLAGLPDGITLMTLEIEGNAGLLDLSGLPPTLTEIPDKVRLLATPVTDLTGLFEHLRRIGGLELESNTALRDLRGIREGTTFSEPMATRQPWSLSLLRNEALVSLDGLPASFAEVPGGVRIHGNSNLVDLAGLEGITSIGADLFIGKRDSTNLTADCDWPYDPGGNARLQTLAGLSGLEYVGGTIAVVCNPALADFATFTALREVGEDIIILENPELTHLTGLGGPGGELLHLRNAYWVYCDPKLEQAEVEAVLAELVEPASTIIDLACE